MEQKRQVPKEIHKIQQHPQRQVAISPKKDLENKVS